MAFKIFRYLGYVSLLCLTILILAGCGGKTDKEPLDEEAPLEKISERDLKEFDEEVQTLIKRGLEVVTVEPTPFDKIAQALEENKITKVQSVILTYIAAFDTENLPKDYQAPLPEEIPDIILMEAGWWLQKNWNSLSEKEQEALEPFYVLPTDPKSFFHPDNQEKRKGIFDRFRLIPLAHAAQLKPTDLIVTVSEKPKKRTVIITYQDDGTPICKQRALWAKESLQRSWPMFENLLGLTPKDDVYLALANLSRLNGEALIHDYVDDRVCVIKVNNTLDERKTKTVTSHELFHAFQLYIPVGSSGSFLFSVRNKSQTWMMEATATWSEHYVWPDYNTEWRWLGYFFSDLHQHMIKKNRRREYATYLFYLFLTQYLDKAIVKKHLHEVATMEANLVVSATDYFDTLFAEFALWNWNQHPELHYRDMPKFPTGVIATPKDIPTRQTVYPHGPSYRSKVHSKNREDHLKVTLNSLSMAYRLHAIKDEVKKLIFKFEKEGDSYHKRQALIKIGEIWHWEDWTDTVERKFCRTRDEERVTAVVLIASNADPNEYATYDLDYDVITEGECNPEWRGTIKWSWEYSSTQDFPFIPATKNYNEHSYMIANETLVYDETEGEFVIKNQYITYYYLESHVTNYFQEYGMQLDVKEQTYKGSTSSSWTIDEKYPAASQAPTRLLRDDDNPLLFEVDIDLHEWGKDWITVIDRRRSSRRATPLEGIWTPAPGTYDRTELDIDYTDRFRNEPNDVEAFMSKDKKHIKAVIKQNMGIGDGEVDVIIEVNYSYK